MTVIGGSIAGSSRPLRFARYTSSNLYLPVDMWATEDRGRPMAVFSSTVFMGPVVGPIIAGYLSAAGWRWNYYLMIIIVGVSWLAAAFFLPETYVNELLFSFEDICLTCWTSLGRGASPETRAKVARRDRRSRLHDGAGKT